MCHVQRFTVGAWLEARLIDWVAVDLSLKIEGERMT